jgi:hypothetical protein
MTIEEIRKSDKAMLTPKDVAELIGVTPYTINVQLREDKERGESTFPFPAFLVGTRVKIPRLPFLKFITGEDCGK